MLARFIRQAGFSLTRIKELYQRSPRRFVMASALFSGVLILLFGAGGYAASRADGIKVASKDPQAALTKADLSLDSTEFFHGGFQVLPEHYSAPETTIGAARPVTFTGDSVTDPMRSYRFDQIQIARKVNPLVIDLSMGDGGSGLWPKAALIDEDDEERPPFWPPYYPPYYPYPPYQEPTIYPPSQDPLPPFTPQDQDPHLPAHDPNAITGAPVPVPSALWLFASGLLGMLGIKGRGERRQGICKKLTSKAAFWSIFSISVLSSSLVLADDPVPVTFAQNGGFYQIVYPAEGKGTEMISMIGTFEFNDFSSFFRQKNVELAKAGNLKLSIFEEASDWSDLRIEFCALAIKALDIDSLPWKEVFAKTTPFAYGNVSGQSVGNFNSGYNKFTIAYNTIGNSTPVPGSSISRTMKIPTGMGRSYNDAMGNKEGDNPGTYAGLNIENNLGFQSLENLGKPGIGYVDMYLFCAEVTDEFLDTCKLIDLDGKEITGNGEQEYIATIRVYADGHTVLNPTNVTPVAMEPLNQEYDEVHEGTPFSLPVRLSQGVADKNGWSVTTNKPEITKIYTLEQTDSSCVIHWSDPRVSLSPVEVTISVTGSGTQDSQKFTLRISPKVDKEAPAIKEIGPQSVDKGKPFSFPVTLTNSESVTEWSLTAKPAGMTISQSGQISWENPLVGAHTVTVVAKNGKGASPPVSFTLTVKESGSGGDDPVIAEIADQEIEAGKAFSLTATVSSGKADEWKLSATGTATGLAINKNSGKISWTKPVAGVYTITLTAVNTTKKSEDTESFKLTVKESGSGGDDPVIAEIADQEIEAGKAFSLTATVSSGKADEWKLSATGTATGLAINKNSGKMSWTKPVAGVYTITLTAVNTTKKSEDTESFKLTVKEGGSGGDNPVIKEIADQEIEAGKAFSLTATVSSGKADEWKLSATGTTTGLAIDKSSGKISWTKPVAGVYTITLTAVNTTKKSEDTESFVLTVKASASTNRPPLKPELVSPMGNILVTDSQPTLIVKEAVDPDNDTVTYLFEVYGDAALETIIAESGEAIQDNFWKIGVVLNNGATLYWRVRAVDKKKAEGPWSETGVFRTNLAGDISGPVLHTPHSGIILKTKTPLLSVYYREYAETPLSYEFEVSSDPTMKQANIVCKKVVSPVPEKSSTDDLIVSCKVPDDILQEKGRYYWRVRANFAASFSSWMQSATFQIEKDKNETTLTPVPANSLAYGNGSKKIVVGDQNSEFYGLTLEIPEGAMALAHPIRISSIKNGPALPQEILTQGKIVDFSPSGVPFDVPVTVKLPYDLEDMEACGVDDPKMLEILTYDPINDLWEPVTSEISVDPYEMLLITEIEHFSMYTVGRVEPATVEPTEENESSDCFIGTLFNEK